MPTISVLKIAALALTIGLLTPGDFCIAQESSGSTPVQTLTLHQALEIALSNNRQIGISQLQVDQAGQRVAQARTGLLPQTQRAGAWRSVARYGERSLSQRHFRHGQRVARSFTGQRHLHRQPLHSGSTIFRWGSR